MAALAWVGPLTGVLDVNRRGGGAICRADSQPIGPTLYDAIVGACQRAGFEPVIGQLAPQIASVVNLVAAELGVTIVPASMSQLRVKGVAYREIAGQAPTAKFALAHRRGESSPIVRNFVARAVS